MLNLRVIQADYGDCFVVEFGAPTHPRYILIDGGPKDVFSLYSRKEMERISDLGGRLDFVQVSHVDKDHILGVLDLFAEIEAQRAANQDDLIGIAGLWLNSFDRTIDHGGDISTRLHSALATSDMAAMPMGALALSGVDQGHAVRLKALQLGIPINEGFPNNLIRVDDAPAPIALDNLAITIVGPTQDNLDALHDEWIAWLDDNETALATMDPRVLTNSDQSIPNLSSVMMHVEADGKTILFTGDGRSDHLMDGLEATRLLDSSGKIHVDVLKVAHHGSDRNQTKTFFKKVTANTYVISANGHPDNPDLATLIWIVESAKQQNRRIKIIATNRRSTFDKLVDEYAPTDYGYELEIMPSHWWYRHIALAP
ncbi:MAG: hypothetical protein OES09_08915 [Gammaproteobacteria bacterium]|nr:hypothetical protein [Gammaproteobacteria bacterium]